MSTSFLPFAVVDLSNLVWHLLVWLNHLSSWTNLPASGNSSLLPLGAGHAVFHSLINFSLLPPLLFLPPCRGIHYLYFPRSVDIPANIEMPGISVRSFLVYSLLMLWSLLELFISLLKDSFASPVFVALTKVLYVVHVYLCFIKWFHLEPPTRPAPFLLSLISRDTSTSQWSLSSSPQHTQVSNPDGLILHFTNTYYSLWGLIWLLRLMGTTLPGGFICEERWCKWWIGHLHLLTSEVSFHCRTSIF